MPANSSMFMDPTWNYSGWVEFYNTGDLSVDLCNYYLTDDPDDPEKYRIPGDCTIPAKGYWTYWFDHNDLSADQANFKLDSRGATLYLYSPDGEIVTSLSYPIQIQNTSYARIMDGEDAWGFCITPSPGETNNGSNFAYERCPEAVFNLTGGVYKRVCRVSLTCPEGMEIRYTTNGSEPTEQSSEWISGTSRYFLTTKVIRACVMAKGHIPSLTTTHTYIITDRDFTLPVSSIVTDPKNLWDDNIGIYCVGTNGILGRGAEYPVNWNQDWSRPANFELLSEKQQLFSQECDIAIGGGHTRANPLKSLKLSAEKKYDGKNTFNHAFFKKKPNLRFKSLLLRPSGNDFFDTMMADAMQQSIIEGVLDVDCQAYQPTIHYLNGEYYGIINLRERNNQHYVYSNFGYDVDSLDVIEIASGNQYEVHKGSMDALNYLVNRSADAYDDNAFQEITQLMDVEEYIVYMITQMYCINWDWPTNNTKIFRHRNAGKFRWVLYDMDLGFKTFENDPFEKYKSAVMDPWWENSYTIQIFRNLIKNTTFRNRFIDYYTLCIGSVFTSDRVTHIIDSIASGIRPEIPYHQQKWSTTFEFEDGVENFKNFAKERPEVLMKSIKDFFNMPDLIPISIKSNISQTVLRMNDIPIPTGVFNGYYYKTQKLTLKAEIPYGYQFEYWKDNKQDLWLLDPEIQLTINEAMDMEAVLSKIPENSELPLSPVRINEVSAENGIYVNELFEQEDWIELYNPADTAVSIAGLYISIDPANLQQYRIPYISGELTVIPPHGYRVLWADKLQDGKELHLPFKLPKEGGILQLTCMDDKAADIETILWKDSLAYTLHGSDRSFGRYPDGSDSLYVMNRPSFATSNLFSIYNVSTLAIPTSLEEIVINDQKNSNGVIVRYCNSTKELTIEIAEGSDVPQTLCLYDLTGHLAKQYHISNGLSTYTINVSDQLEGYYIAVIQCADGLQVTCRFIQYH